MNIKFIKPIRLNRGGKIIGQLVKFYFKGKWLWAYYSPRTPEHYFIKYHGFGIDKALLKNLMMVWHLDYIIIHYKGVKGERFLLSNLDNWYMKGIDVEYSKDMGYVGETYGSQKILNEDYMKLLG